MKQIVSQLLFAKFELIFWLISRLDLSDNLIDAEMSGVMHGIARNKSIVSLNVSKNMTGIKPKYLPNVMEAIVQLLQVYIYFHVNPFCYDKIFFTHFL